MENGIENILKIDEANFMELRMEMAQFVEGEINEDGLKDFKAQFLIMFNSLVSSFNSNISTQRNFNETNDKLMKNIRNKNDICKRIEENQDRILNIKQEFENLYLKIDSAKTEEMDLDKQIKFLNDEIIRLNQRKDKDNLTNFKPEELELKEKLKADVDDLDVKYEQITTHKNQIIKQLDTLLVEKNRLEKISSELDMKKKLIDDEKTSLYTEYDYELNNKIKIDEQFKKTKNENIEIKKSLGDLDDALFKLREEQKTLDKALDDIEDKISNYQKQIKKLVVDRPKKLKDLKELDKKREEYEKILKDNQLEILNIEKEILDIRKEAEEYEKIRNKLENKIAENEKETFKYKEQSDETKNQIRDIEKTFEDKKIILLNNKEELLSRKKIDNEEKKKIENLTDELTSIHNENIFVENTIRRAMNEAIGIKKETQSLEHEKEVIEAEKNMYSKQSSDAQMEFFQAKERLKNLNEAIADLKAKNLALEQKAKQQKKIYEAVKGDCNRFEKKYQEAKGEIKDITEDKSKKSQRYQFLKIELNYKQKVLADLDKEYSKKEEDLGKEEESRKTLKEDIQKIKISIETYQESNNNLNKTISLAEVDHQGQVKEYSLVVNERDFINQQLIQRQEEIQALYEKIKVLQGELLKMNKQYEKKLTEIENLKNSRDFLTEEFIKTENIIKNIFELRVTKIKLEKELLITKNKLKSLEDQTKKPLNIHRWTKLEYSDPEKFELITQINSLQRRLIAKTEEVNHKEDLIQEKEKLYIKLKGIVARQSGVDMSESLKNYQKMIREENSKLKKMSEEVKHLSLTIRNYELEIKKLDKEMNSIKMNWINERKQGIQMNNEYGE